MKLPKRTKKRRYSISGVQLRQFFVRHGLQHGEKAVAGLLILAAIGLALRAFYYQSLPWQPEELTTLADNTEKAIKANEHFETDIQETLFDYARYAGHIRTQVPFAPYQSGAEWYPILLPSPPPRSGFEVLAAESLRGEAVRRSGLTLQGTMSGQGQRLPPGILPSANAASSLWVNLFVTLPVHNQWEIYNQIFDTPREFNRPEYVYYELERTAVKPNEALVWQPVIVPLAAEIRADLHYDFSPERLIPFALGLPQAQDTGSLLLFSDFDIEPATTYIYRIRLYLTNPNYHMQLTSVLEGVDTKNEFVRSDWHLSAMVAVPDRTSVRLHSVTPSDPAEFPRQTAPLRPVRGTLILDYFDVELGQSLPEVEKREVLRGMLANMPKDEANRFINRNRSPGEAVNVNYPDSGLRSGICVMDFHGGRPLQKRLTREAQASPDLFVTGRALLLMPDGTMQTLSTAPKFFR